jgi:hypothetical protein
MSDVFVGWSPKHVIGLTAVIGAFLTAIIMTIAIVWYQSRRESLLANLKNDYLERGFTIDQIDRLLRSPEPSALDAARTEEKSLEANLASLLVQYEVPAATMERVLKTFQETEATSKKAIYDAIEEMLEAEVASEQLLAAVNMLCQPRNANQPRPVAAT